LADSSSIAGHKASLQAAGIFTEGNEETKVLSKQLQLCSFFFAFASFCKSFSREVRFGDVTANASARDSLNR
jgi:hypothetical protein